MLNRILITLGRFGIYLIPFLIGIIVVFGWFKSTFGPLNPGSTKIIPFLVNPGVTFTSIGKDLEAQRIVKKDYAVWFLSKLKVAADTKLLVGEYEMSDGYTPAQVLDVLISRKIIQHDVLIPEGTSMHELPRVFAKSGLVTEDEMQQALASRTLLIELSIPARTMEGYIFPDTYSFSRPISAEQMIAKVVNDGKKKLDESLRGWRERAREIGYNEYQILTLASIIEKETGKASERATISSVFHNRLRIGMPLQSDPTVIYGIPNFNGNLTKDDLKAEGPYNTYVNLGLPPTPICNPGVESVKAALYPEDTDYLYFVAKGDGSHQFSKTYKEHQAAVETYQKAS